MHFDTVSTGNPMPRGGLTCTFMRYSRGILRRVEDERRLNMHLDTLFTGNPVPRGGLTCTLIRYWRGILSRTEAYYAL